MNFRALAPTSMAVPCLPGVPLGPEPGNSIPPTATSLPSVQPNVQPSVQLFNPETLQLRAEILELRRELSDIRGDVAAIRNSADRTRSEEPADVSDTGRPGVPSDPRAVRPWEPFRRSDFAGLDLTTCPPPPAPAEPRGNYARRFQLGEPRAPNWEPAAGLSSPTGPHLPPLPTFPSGDGSNRPGFGHNESGGPGRVSSDPGGSLQYPVAPTYPGLIPPESVPNQGPPRLERQEPVGGRYSPRRPSCGNKAANKAAKNRYKR